MLIDKIKRKISDLYIRSLDVNRINVASAMLHQETFAPFKNYCAGKKLVVCGAGPSLQNYKPIESAVHIALNRSFLFDKVDFDFIFAQDWDGVKMVQPQLKDYRPGKCVKLLGSSCTVQAKEIPESFAIACGALRFNTDSYIYGNGFKSKFVVDVAHSSIGAMPNVGLSVMQFALYMNPEEIYIVGIDCSGTHFSNGNNDDTQVEAERKRMEREWAEAQDKLIDKWKEFKAFASLYYPETKIISVNPVGLKGIFEDIFQ